MSTGFLKTLFLITVSLSLMAFIEDDNASQSNNSDQKAEFPSIPLPSRAKNVDLIIKSDDGPLNPIVEFKTNPIGTKKLSDFDTGPFNDLPLITNTGLNKTSSLFDPTLSEGKETSSDLTEVDQTGVFSAASDGDLTSQDAPTTKAIYGQDDRRELTKNRNVIDNRIGQLIVGDPFGKRTQCSGTLISPRHVVTAAHCVVNVQNGNFLSGSIAFVPGRVESMDPYGLYYAKRVYVLKAFKTILQNSNYKITYGLSASDMAVIELNKSPMNGKLGYMAIQPFSYNAQNVSLIGYPGDKKSGSKWSTECSYVSDKNFLNGLIVGTYCDTFQGMSGGPLLEKKPNGKYAVVGVLSAGPDGQQNPGNPRTSMAFAHFKSGNPFRWADLKNMWLHKDMGSLDWPIVWSNYNNLINLLPSTLSQQQKVNINANLKALTSVYNVPQTKKVYYMDVINQCSKEIQVALGFKQSGAFKYLGYFNLKYGQKIQIPNESKTHFYYAHTLDGKKKWGGDDPRTVRGRTINMEARTVNSSVGYYRTNLTFTCP